MAWSITASLSSGARCCLGTDYDVLIRRGSHPDAVNAALAKITLSSYLHAHAICLL